MLKKLFGSENPTAAKTRLERNPEAKEIVHYLHDLKKKADEFKKSADKLGPSSLAYGKHIVISLLINNMNVAVNAYNAKKMSPNDITETQVFIGLLRELDRILKEVLQNASYMEILGGFRNAKQTMINKVDTAAAVVGTVGFWTTPLPVGLSIWAAEMAVRYRFSDQMKNKKSATCLLLAAFQDALTSTIKNLILSVNIKQLSSTVVRLSDEDNMVCPITGQLMENPVVFRVDGFSYEKSAIETWLREHRNSPLTRAVMPEGARLEEVLIPNRGLKNVIDNYKLYHKDALNEEQPENRTLSIG